MMETSELVKALRKEAAANPCAELCSACDISECMTRLQIQAADQIEEQERQIQTLKAALSAMEQDLRRAASGWDGCQFCAHFCNDGKPVYRPDEEYLVYCEKCNGSCCFEWRGIFGTEELK